jgi:dolichol-phosphate mannosyltransferase
MITILIPTRNEAENIGHAIIRIKDALAGLDYEIIVVDESGDSTAAIAKKMGARVIRPKEHLGLGAALKLGLKNAKGDIIVTMDADLSHKPEDITRLVNQIDGFDVVLGSRYVAGARRQDSGYRQIAPRIASLLYRLMGSRIRDLTTGFRAYKTGILKRINISKLPDSYAFQPAILLELMKKGARIDEVAIVFERRFAGESKYRTKEMVNNIILVLKAFIQ